MSTYDSKGLFQFLSQTPESGLRKMLVDNKPMTEVHFNLLIKILRHSQEAEFCELFEKQEIPKIKLSPNETKLKEVFWKDLTTTCLARGLLSKQTQAA